MVIELIFFEYGFQVHKAFLQIPAQYFFQVEQEMKDTHGIIADAFKNPGHLALTAG